MAEKKWTPGIGFLVDLLSINQLKQAIIPEKREEITAEIEAIVHDIQAIIDENPDAKFTGEFIRDVIIIAQYNAHIFFNEDKERAFEIEKEENIDWEARYKNLRLTHSLNNGVRNPAKNRLQTAFNGRLEHKTITLYPEHENWRPSGY